MSNSMGATDGHPFSLAEVLLESIPDAVISVDTSGVITFANGQVEVLFGYSPAEVVGRPIEVLLPERVRAAHREHRGHYLVNPVARPMGAGFQLAARRRDGGEFPVDISLSAVQTPDGLITTAFVRDVTQRMQAEQAAQRLRETEIRRRQALEINDSVVQGVATAVYALDRHDPPYALSALQATLEAARMMMDRLLEHDADTNSSAPDLVRDHPATVLHQVGDPTPPDPAEQSGTDVIRVVVADDTPDMRLMMRLSLQSDHGIQVVGEAADGHEAVEAAYEHQPDIVLLDLAMPVMDGLQAIPLIRAASPDSRIVVLSGYGAEDIIDAALRAGADAYATKGRPTESLCTLLRELCPAKNTHLPPPPTPFDEPVGDIGSERLAAQDHALAVTVNELATPIMVLEGMLTTLSERMDALPSAVVRELLGVMARQVQQMSDLLATLNDARHISRDTLRLEREPTDLGAFVHRVAHDLTGLLQDHTLHVDACEGVTVNADPLRLRQVITNLVTNAIKAGPPGTSIDIGVTPLVGTVRVSVTDQGRGIPEHRRPQLFAEFSRLTADTSGMGLGLYIARGIIHAHGGELRLRRTGPAGSTFAFELPVTVTAAGTNPPGRQ